MKRLEGRSGRCRSEVFEIEQREKRGGSSNGSAGISTAATPRNNVRQSGSRPARRRESQSQENVNDQRRRKANGKMGHWPIKEGGSLAHKERWAGPSKLGESDSDRPMYCSTSHGQTRKHELIIFFFFFWCHRKRFTELGPLDRTPCSKQMNQST